MQHLRIRQDLPNQRGKDPTKKKHDGAAMMRTKSSLPQLRNPGKKHQSHTDKKEAQGLNGSEKGKRGSSRGSQ
jgi:hypothetical protein